MERVRVRWDRSCAGRRHDAPRRHCEDSNAERRIFPFLSPGIRHSSWSFLLSSFVICLHSSWSILSSDRGPYSSKEGDAFAKTLEYFFLNDFLYRSSADVSTKSEPFLFSWAFHRRNINGFCQSGCQHFRVRLKEYDSLRNVCLLVQLLTVIIEEMWCLPILLHSRFSRNSQSFVSSVIFTSYSSLRDAFSSIPLSYQKRLFLFDNHTYCFTSFTHAFMRSFWTDFQFRLWVITAWTSYFLQCLWAVADDHVRWEMLGLSFYCGIC